MNKEIILNKSLFIVLVMTYDRSWKPGIQNGEGKGENSQNFKIQGIKKSIKQKKKEKQHGRES